MMVVVLSIVFHRIRRKVGGRNRKQNQLNIDTHEEYKYGNRR
jgi:hypothetical protein